MKTTRRRPRAAPLVAVAAALMAVAAPAVPAGAGANRCDTEPPSRPPTWEDETGAHWLDEHGAWTQGPEGSMFGGAGVDGDDQTLEVDAWSNHSLQARLGSDRQCARAGIVTVGGDDAGEFPVEAPPDVPPLPWLRRDGTLFRADDGRSTILRGVDYPYNQEIFEAPYNLVESDFERIASWGMNLLRIRISSARSGFLPGTAPEPGYWEHLDQLVAAANRRGIYVMVSTVTSDLEAMSTTAGHDQLKFVPGSPNHEWWLSYQQTLFERYLDWPGVVGFDPLNEDNSFPPYLHDRVFMGALHEQANAVLRERDDRHVYFQEPSGWSYWGAEWWPGMMQGHDVGDPNRFYCPKYKPGGDAGEEIDVKSRLATESGVPMFVCEMWIDSADPGTVSAWQRDAQHAMDARLMGGVRVLYGPSAGYGTHTRDGVEAHWIDEFARPYPVWAGGRVIAIAYDYDARRLVVDADLDGSGPTEIFAPVTRTYGNGFVATASTGDRLVHDGSTVVEATGMWWDGDRQHVVLPVASGLVRVTIEPVGVTGLSSPT